MVARTKGKVHNMKTAQLETTSGYKWKTSLADGVTLESVKRYFMGRKFNIGTYPTEKMEKVVHIALWDKDGQFIKA
jgi:hypothetical protein